MTTKKVNLYKNLIEDIFLRGYRKGVNEIQFTSLDFKRAAKKLGIDVPQNVQEAIYSFRYRKDYPTAISKTAKKGCEWVLRGGGDEKYRFSMVKNVAFSARSGYAETRIIDVTPQAISRYVLIDKQAVLALVRFNRLIDIFTGLTCCPLQSYLQTDIAGIEQVDNDIYIGMSRQGVEYLLFVHATGRNNKIRRVHIEQDFAIAAEKFPNLICKSIAAQFMPNETIALFELESNNEGVAIVAEKHYRLVHPSELSFDELEIYKTRLN
jgi:hypothetical protein